MKFSKTVLGVALLASALLAGCQTQSNTLTFTTPPPNAMFNSYNQTALVNVITQDHRQSMDVAHYTQNGSVRRLMALPDAVQLFQQTMQQNLGSRGFTVVQGAGNANVIVNVKRFFADVAQGNLRYKVSANVNVEVIVQGARGQLSKNFNTSRAYDGAFGANNAEIQKILGQAYYDAVQAIYSDNEISNAIHQVK